MMAVSGSAASVGVVWTPASVRVTAPQRRIRDGRGHRDRAHGHERAGSSEDRPPELPTRGLHQAISGGIVP
jgi:hypothetical protein